MLIRRDQSEEQTVHGESAVSNAARKARKRGRRSRTNVEGQEEVVHSRRRATAVVHARALDDAAALEQRGICNLGATGSLILEPLCGERAHPGLGGRRSATQRSARYCGRCRRPLTLVLAAGARARVLATSAVLSVAVEHAEEIAQACGKGADQAYSASVNDGDAEYDPIGLSYESASR